ncbi:MAG: sensor histidine kinase [Prosthecobacter sp.]
MRKPLHIWVAFLACFGLLLGAMAWVGWHTLTLERERETAARDADQQERVRLALWRLDFQASALMMRENARPPHDFRPFHAPEGLVNKMYGNVTKGDVLVPSPLLAEVPEHVLLHFQMDSRGQIISPQVPQNDERTLALAQFLNADVLQRSEQRLSGLRELLARPSAGVVPAPAPQATPKVSARGMLAPVEAPKPTTMLNRQLLAQTACVAQFQFDDKERESVLEMNDASLPRNAAWAQKQGQVVAQQQIYNNLENVSRSRAITAQAEEAMKQQSSIKMKEAPSKELSKTYALKPEEKTASASPSSGGKALGKKLEEGQADDKALKVPAAASRASPASPSPALAAAPKPAPAAPAAGGAMAPSLPPAPPPPAQVAVSTAMAPAAAATHSLTTGGKEVTRKADTGAAPNSSRPFQGVWLGDSLVLTREAFVDGMRTVQGVWLDWPALQAAWLREITDLFPDAGLLPGANAGLNSRPIDDPLRFAALPVRLAPSRIQLPPLPFWTPLRKSLGIALACVLLAGAAVGLVLHGTVALSERRAAFVSAVTHELRTPLTTFRLYSEMLADGMVQDETQRKTYLDTLTGEAGRLSHLVENVLSYARLERGSAKARAENISIGTLLDRVLPRLQQRADDCGMEVRVHATEADRKTQLHIDAAAVEQILFNLVDNACKYAAPRAAEPVIHLEADTGGKFAMLRVRDHGGGISRNERRRIFHPFHKSADQAAHSAPGVGLGLALCRRLATALGGAITLDATHKEGACFVLRLPK